jgi:hypothetical protein
VERQGKVIGKRHRHQEFIWFLNVIEARGPTTMPTTSIQTVMQWLEKHRRFVFHFTPTSASCSTLSRASLPSLQRIVSSAAYSDPAGTQRCHPPFLDDTKANPKPLTWTKDPNKIIAALRRGHQVSDPIY